MARPSGIEIGSLIDRDPKIRGGRPKIAGTGLTVSRIAGWYKRGMSSEEIALEYPHLTLAQVPPLWREREHLEAAVRFGRSLFTHNTADYDVSHQRWISDGRAHAGIIVSPQQRYSVGEEMRRIMRLISRRTAE